MIALITGSSRGIGRGIALSLAEAGATIYLTGRNTTGLDETAEEVSRRGGRAISVRCDHTDDSQVEALFGRMKTAARLFPRAFVGTHHYACWHRGWRARMA